MGLTELVYAEARQTEPTQKPVLQGLSYLIWGFPLLLINLDVTTPPKFYATCDLKITCSL